MLDTDSTGFKQRLIDARDYAKNRGLPATNVRLADLTGVSVQAIGQWFQTGNVDKRHHPTIATAYGVSLIWLSFGLGEMIQGAAETLTEQETDLVQQFRRLTSAQRADIIGIIESRVTANEQIMNELGRPPASSGALPPLPPGAFEATAARPSTPRKKTQK